MNILALIKSQHLSQGALVAGSIRNTVWQKLHHQKFELESDIDVVFFDKMASQKANLVSQTNLNTWQVKNEVYLHNYDFKNQLPFTSVVDAIAHFVETPTCNWCFP
jgi:hypothetical protein